VPSGASNSSNPCPAQGARRREVPTAGARGPARARLRRRCRRAARLPSIICIPSIYFPSFPRATWAHICRSCRDHGKILGWASCGSRRQPMASSTRQQRHGALVAACLLAGWFGYCSTRSRMRTKALQSGSLAAVSGRAAAAAAADGQCQPVVSRGASGRSRRRLRCRQRKLAAPRGSSIVMCTSMTRGALVTLGWVPLGRSAASACQGSAVRLLASTA
jgi:hypothetical protein